MNNSSQVRTVPAARTSFLLREHPRATPGSTPVLLLHGMPETSSCWNEVAPGLADGRRVLAPDLPGVGGSTYAGPFDIPSLVSQLAALIEAEVPGGRVDVVGHDWGGSLALALAGARPELVRRLVVANAPYRQVPLLRGAYIPFLALPVAPELLFKLGGRRVIDRVFAGLWKSPTPLDEEKRAEYGAAYTDPVKIAAMLGYYRAAVRPRLARLVLRDAVPVRKPSRVRAEKALVLWGAADPILPVSLGEGVVRDLGADCVMVTVPGAGHFVIEEAPEVVTRVLLDFLGDEATPAVESAAPPEKPAKAHEPIEPPPPAVLEEPAKPALRTRRIPATAPPRKNTATRRAAPQPLKEPGPVAAPAAAADPAVKKRPATKAPAKTPAPAPATKAPAKKAPAKRASAKKAPAQQAPAEKAPVKKAPAKKAPVKKAPAKKAPAKKTPAKKTPGSSTTGVQAPSQAAPVRTPGVRRGVAQSTPAANPPAKRGTVIRPRPNQP